MVIQMLIKENKLRNLIRSIIKEAIGSGSGGKPFKFAPEDLSDEPYSSFDSKPGQMISSTSYDFDPEYSDIDDEDYDPMDNGDEDEYDSYDYEDSLEGDTSYRQPVYSSYSDDEAGQRCWDAQRPGSTPKFGDECYEGRKIYTWVGDQWKVRMNNRRF